MVKGILVNERGDNPHVDDHSRSGKSVCWGKLVIYEFPNILGDNPSVTNGSPITISWKHQSRNVIDVYFYELLKQGSRRRSRKELQMKAVDRDTFLLGLGYSLDQLMEVTEECRKIRESRRLNMKGTTWTKFIGVVEKTSKGVIDVTAKGVRKTTNVITSPIRATTNAISAPMTKLARSA